MSPIRTQACFALSRAVNVLVDKALFIASPNVCAAAKYRTAAKVKWRKRQWQWEKIQLNKLDPKSTKSQKYLLLKRFEILSSYYEWRLYGRRVKFRKVARQQIWGEVWQIMLQHFAV